MFMMRVSENPRAKIKTTFSQKKELLTFQKCPKIPHGSISVYVVPWTTPDQQKLGTNRMPPKKKPKMSDSVSGSAILADHTFAISGTLSVPRAQFEKLITDNGGSVASSVTGKVRCSCFWCSDGPKSSRRAYFQYFPFLASMHVSRSRTNFESYASR